ncbi:hypothetical protein CPC08DRAFT_769742 [Agrocybe pediades]|nr:hypothetical protein CPC08DRAFT_769742 [Agrocybe pediades]
MTNKDHSIRPTISEVVERFEKLANALSTSQLRSRTASRRANIFTDFSHLLAHWRRRIVYMAKPSISDELCSKLDGSEVIWRDSYAWLKEHGYQLRPRYAPDWTPSRNTTKKTTFTSEDGSSLIFPQISDAIHLPSGQHVAIKLVYKQVHPTEKVLRPLGDENDDLKMLVMPYVRIIETPPSTLWGR